jgi:hypothetical protein
VVIPPELCDWWWPASGGSAPSEKTRPAICEHVYVNLVNFQILEIQPFLKNFENLDY